MTGGVWLGWRCQISSLEGKMLPLLLGLLLALVSLSALSPSLAHDGVLLCVRSTVFFFTQGAQQIWALATGRHRLKSEGRFRRGLNMSMAPEWLSNPSGATDRATFEHRAPSHH